jgi:hypothetical protein
LPSTPTVEVKTGAAEQVVSPTPKRKKVMLPSGWNPPDSIAVSVKMPPAGVVPEGVVAIVGVALKTTTLSPSSPQLVAAGPLLASPP